jgi:hypothetical protein
MKLLHSTVEETCREYCSQRHDPRAGGYQPSALPDRIRITRRRTWWLGPLPVWRRTVGVLEMPIPARAVKPPPVRP